MVVERDLEISRSMIMDTGVYITCIVVTLRGEYIASSMVI
jgi:hypothetical protein